MKYGFIREHGREYPISTMCRVLEVAVSGYYAWLKRAPSRRGPREYGVGGARGAHLSGESAGLWQSTYPCGAPCAISQACGKKRVARLMREHGLNAKPRKRRTRTTDGQHEQPVAPNLLNREFTATAPNTRVGG